MNELFRDDAVSVLRRMAEKPERVASIGMVLADPPYGLTQTEFDRKIPFEPLWDAFGTLLRRNGAVVLFSQQPFTTELICGAKREFTMRTEWIWEKKSPSGHLNSAIYPLKAHENILVFCREVPTYYPQKLDDEPVTSHGGNQKTKNYGKFDPQKKDYSVRRGRYPRDVLRASDFPNVKGRGQLHPQQKPVNLLRYLIRTYTQPGETVLDFSMGSGSTGVAAIMERRDFIGIELSEDYYNVAKKRIGKAMEEL